MKKQPNESRRLPSAVPLWRLKALLGILIPVIALGAGCGSTRGNPSQASPGGGEETHQESTEEEDAIAVRTARVRREPLSSLYSTSATLRADKQATVTARTRGVVRDLLVEEGDQVAADQPLARLEDDEQRIEFERARFSRDTKKREYERVRKLHSQGLISDEEFENIRREAEEAEHTASLAELILSRTVIHAPFHGVILRRHLDVGATVVDGTDVYDIADLDPLYADVNVPERNVARLAVGQTVRLTTDAAGEEVSARIERIAPSVDPSTGTVKVTLAVIGNPGLRPGAFVRVNIVTATHPNALVVPRSALVAEGRRWHLFRLNEEESRVQQLEVKLGFEEGNRVEILEVVGEGVSLEPEVRVISVGAAALADGSRVRIMDPEGEEGTGETLVAP